MDTTDLEITFDENGHCDHCTAFLASRGKHTYNGAESDAIVDRMFQTIARDGRGKEYDCIIGVSGGADSSYLTHFVKGRGLRPLAVHMDNGWNSEKAVINIKNVTRKLGVGYESFVLDWEEFKDIQLAFLRASVPEAETPTDVAIPAALHRVAIKYGIKHILSGGNLQTEGILPKSWHYDIKDLKYFRHIHQTFGKKPLKKFPTFGYIRESYYKLVKGIRTHYPLNHVPFVKKDAIKELEEKFDWKNFSGKHYESRYTKFIQSYYLFEKFPIDYRRATLSSEICANDVTRECALEKLRSLPYDAVEIEDDKLYIAKKLGVSLDEFQSIIRLPAKWYWDYPNDYKKHEFIYDVYRKVFRKEKIDRF